MTEDDSSPFTRRHVLESAAVLGLGRYAVGRGTAAEDHEDPTLNRFAVTALGAEITGLFLTRRGDLFFNVQHPNGSNEEPYDRGAVGVVERFSMHDLPRDFGSVSASRTPDQTDEVRTAFGRHRVLADGGDPIEGTDERLGVAYSADGEAMTGADDPDYNGYVPDPEDPNRGYLFSNWETSPGVVTRMTLERTATPKGPTWEVLGKRNVDFRPVEGTWTNCFGTVSPWGTPLTSEEYEPDAEGWYADGGNDTYREYLGYEGNPYRYGYIVEIEAPTTDDPTPRKRFALGRFAHENCVVMPDERTVYLSDDGSNTVFFKFVADEAGDLRSGTLYAAKVRQESGRRSGEVSFLLEWRELTHAEESEIEFWIAEYDRQDPAEADYLTDEDVRRWVRGEAADDRVAFLESRRAAAAVGATNEFNKMEGVNVRRGAEPGDYLYMAMSNVSGGMTDNSGDVRVTPNEYGVVYRLPLTGDYDVRYMEPAVAGGPNATVCGGCPMDARPGSGSSVCADCSYNPNNESEGLPGPATSLLESQRLTPENTLANPDNIVVMDDGRVVIGEDSVRQNNMVWIFDPGEE